MSTALETVKNFMGVLKNYSQDTTVVGQTALNDAVRHVSLYSGLNEAVTKFKNALKDTETYPDTTTRLYEATGMILGTKGNYEIDTGAITGANAGGPVVKDAQSIVPEDDDLSNAAMPEPGSTTPITYTGEDGKSFTFYVKWPESFTTIVEGFTESDDGELARIRDTKYRLDLDTLNQDDYYIHEKKDSDNKVTSTTKSPTYGQMKSAIETSIKGLYNYWLREGAKLDYDSLGLALNGQTIEIAFVAGGSFDNAGAITYGNRDNTLPSNHIYLAISLFEYGIMNPTDPNGNTDYQGREERCYLDRVIAHELVHAVMFATGTEKYDSLPQFFSEGIAELVHGDNDYNSDQLQLVIDLVNDSDTLKEALNFEPGTGSKYSYPAGYMFMRFLANRNLNTTAIEGDPNQAETFSYDTNNAVITNYTSEDVVDYQRNIADAWTSQTLDDLIIKEKTGNDDSNELILRDVRGKVVTLNTASGTAYAYLAPNAGEVDARNFNGGNNYQIIFGSDYSNDIIRAGNGGSELWGGLQGSDALFGGAGVDTFVYYWNDGNDIIQNAESQDIVFIREMTLDKIVGAEITDGGVNLSFRDRGSLNISGTPTTFYLEDPDEKVTTYHADYQNKTWSQA